MDGIDHIVNGDNSPNNSVVVDDGQDLEVVPRKHSGGLSPVVGDLTGDNLGFHELGDGLCGFVSEQLTNRDNAYELVGEVGDVYRIDRLNIDGHSLHGGDGGACGGFFIDGDELGGHQATCGVRGVFEEFADVFGLLGVFLLDGIEDEGLGWIWQGGDDIGGVVGGHLLDEANEFVGFEVGEELTSHDGVSFFDDDFPFVFGEDAVNVETLKRA